MRFWKAWFQSKDGTTAIEFSLLAIPYFMLTIGIIELGMMYATASLLEGATSSAARLVRTGQAQQSGGNAQTMFEEALCDYADVLMDCSKIVYEATPMDSYYDYSDMAANYNEEGDMVSRGFNPGGSDQKILIRVSYRYTMLTPLIGNLLAAPSGQRTFTSTLVLQTEPYEFGGGSV